MSDCCPMLQYYSLIILQYYGHVVSGTMNESPQKYVAWLSRVCHFVATGCGGDSQRKGAGQIAHAISEKGNSLIAVMDSDHQWTYWGGRKDIFR